MAHITEQDVNAWLEPTKLTVSTLDPNLETQVTNLVYARLLGTFDTSTWVNEATTPQIVRTIIAMYYVAWTYDKTYSDTDDSNPYAMLLRQYADLNINGLIAGTIELVELPTANTGVSSPGFFPNDASSARVASDAFPSDGPPAFTMGTVF